MYFGRQVDLCLKCSRSEKHTRCDDQFLETIHGAMNKVLSGLEKVKIAQIDEKCQFP
jgi:hypothetical protein